MKTEQRISGGVEAGTPPEPMVEFRDGAWWVVEHRPGTVVWLPSLAPDQCVMWGDGETYYRLLTRTDATTEAEALASLAATREKL